MRPSEKKTTTESIELYKQSLQGNNYSLQSIKAYLGDLAQFIKWLQTRRVDWDIPHRIERIDIVQFINHLAEQKASAITRNLLQNSHHTLLTPFEQTTPISPKNLQY
jgi:site-specific recombinase XerD